MSGRETGPDTGGEKRTSNLTEDRMLILAAFRGDKDDMQRALERGADINAVDADTGLSALHIAVGSNDLSACRFLIEEHKAGFFADRFGRLPTVVAIDCRADDELFAFIAEKEAEAQESAG